MSLEALCTRMDHFFDTGVICQLEGLRGGETHAVRTHITVGVPGELTSRAMGSLASRQ